MIREEASAICEAQGLKLASTMTPEDFRRIEEKLDAVLAISQKVERIADSVASQVKPVLDDLMKSPLLKMLGVKKS